MTDEMALSYRKSAIEGASPIGLVIALYDTLWGDLCRAAIAVRKNDIELRCKELNHASLVLGQLEDWVDVKNGGALAQNLKGFYGYLRAKMMEAGLTKSASLLEEQMKLILHDRSAWQQRDSFPDPPVTKSSEIPFGRESVRTASSSERAGFSQDA
jgi:flagellar protein FliS